MATISIKLKPGAKKNSIDLKDDGTLAISVTSRPANGKANEQLIKLLSKALRISKSSCEIIQGSKSRFKMVAVKGIEREEIYSKLANMVTR